MYIYADDYIEHNLEYILKNKLLLISSIQFPLAIDSGGKQWMCIQYYPTSGLAVSGISL